MPSEEPPEATPAPAPPPLHRSDADRRRATDWYAATRLGQRRTVRLAFAAGALARGEPARAREVWRGAAGLVDLPGPELPARSPHPHLRVAHLGAEPVTAGVVAGVRLTPTTWRTILQRDRPDLVLVDEVAGWPLEDLRTLLHDVAVPAGFVWPHVARAAGGSGRLPTLPDDHPALLPAVDPRRTNPIGATPANRPARLLRPGAGHDADAEVLGALASGSPVLAPRTPRLAALLGPTRSEHHLLDVPGDTTARLEALQGDWHRASVRARTHVLRHHSTAARTAALLAAAGLEVAPPTVSVLLATNRADRVVPALEAVAGQAGVALEVHLLLHGIDPPVDPARVLPAGTALRVHRVGADQPLGAVLNVGLAAATGDLVAKIDDDDLYGPDHLADLQVALAYSGADVVGRWGHGVHLVAEDLTVPPDPAHEEVWASHLPGATMLVHADVLRRLRWRHVPNAVDTELVRAVHAAGGHTYSTHRFGFVRRRHGQHTFRRTDATFRRGTATTPGLDERLLGPV